MFRLLVNTISNDKMSINCKTREIAEEVIKELQNKREEMIHLTAEECDIFIQPKYVESIRVYEEDDED